MARAPFVAMQTDLRKEERVDVIAEITGHDRDAVLGKLFRLWAWCTDRGLEDAPADCDGYAVPERVVRQFLGERGVDAMLGDGCDELAMGVRRPDGLIYLRGTAETVTRLRALKSTVVAGGLARVRSPAGEPVSRVNGRFVSNKQNHQLPDQLTPSEQSADGPADISSEPAATSVYPQTTDHILPTEEYNPEIRPSAVPAEPALLLSGLAQPPKAKPPAPKPRARRKRDVSVTDDERATAMRVLDKLGERNEVKYRGSDEHMRLIVRHLRDGRTEMDLRKIIAYCAEPKKNGGRGWEDDPSMRQYLAPETLFGPETIHKYLDPALSWADRAYPEAK